MIKYYQKKTDQISMENNDIKAEPEAAEEIDIQVDGDKGPEAIDKTKLYKTRNNIQISRRLVHMGMGVAAATIYNVAMTHQQAVYILGTCACVMYIFEQVRVSYPEYADKFNIVTKYFLRAEEQLQESASVPYAMAILLTIITFPKTVAVTSIYILAIADPLSAIIGIKLGKHPWSRGKSLEGSAAFFVSAFLCIVLTFSNVLGYTFGVWILALIGAFIGTLFEAIPLRVDDNLTIPLFSAVTLWILSGILGLPLWIY